MRRKDADKIRRAKKKLKGLDICLRLASSQPCSLMIAFVGITRISKQNVRNSGWINILVIHGFWTFNGSIRLKLTETGNVCVITHDADLEELFPGNELISDNTR